MADGQQKKKQLPKKKEKKDPRGRLKVISEDQIDKLVKSLRTGIKIKDACLVAGIAERTYFRYMSIGRQYENTDEEDIPEDDYMYWQFWQSVKQAEPLLKLKLLNDIAQDPNWQAKAWILERRFPEDFGRLNRVVLEQKQIDDKVKELTLEDLDAEIIQLEKEINQEDEDGTEG